MEKKYDILLFGVTGFTGGLAAEHLLTKSYPVKWACCARNEAKAKAVLSELTTQLGKAAPVIEVADLVCKTPEDEAKLRAVVQKTRVVLTTAGPFEKYGQTLVCVTTLNPGLPFPPPGSNARVPLVTAQALCRRGRALRRHHGRERLLPHDDRPA